jgi:hypothetical protein
MLRVALGWQYRGRRVHQGAVVYCCFEGATGFEARTEAFRQRYLAEQTDPVPFYLVPVTLNLVRDKDDLIEAIKAEIGVINPVAVVLDTLNRSLEGSESSDEDMTAYVQACDVIREQFDCAVIIVHHCGVTGDRPRGHTSLTGSADAQLMVKRPNKGAFTVTVELMKDGAEGDTIGCDLDLVEVGKDEDGDLITSCVVIETDDQPAAATKLTANQQSYLNILQEAGRDGLTLSDWNEKARDNGLGVKRRTDLMDYRHALKEKKLIHSYADRWHAT